MKINKQIAYPVSFVLLLWIIKVIEELFNFNFVNLGIAPGEFSGLPGIILAPLIHADFNHLIANSFPLIFLGIGLFYFFPSSSKWVSIFIYIIPNIFVWFLGRTAYHIGASGIVYGLVTFIFSVVL